VLATPVKLGVAALVAYAVFRRRSKPARASGEENGATANIDDDGATEPIATGTSLEEPISPELALVDSSIRERLVEDPVDVMPLDESTATPSDAGDEAAPPRARRRRRKGVAASVVLAVGAAATAGVYIARDVEATHDGPTATPTTATAPPGGTTSTVTTPVGRAFAWAPVANATSYDVAILKGGRIVYDDSTSVPRIIVPAQWQRDGRTMSLTAGSYQWYVWPVFRSGQTHRRGAPVVATTFDIG
jgi:hypothetical protein